MVSTLEGDMKLEDLHFYYQMRPAQKVGKSPFTSR